ncbi:LL-diaminopimelate aminotransferase [Thermodesulfovibrionales bacterium]|nr:LL-diaminopimelate aminotransferase [Thermodesulfovibrionales bacterium]MCL0074566.1 LL-diaminopimelate aminotransferase [Thermodesulfovibrionales bacterium]
MTKFRLASRVEDLPPYPFATIDKMKQDALSKGVDLIDLSIGDPDLPTPKHIVNAMKMAVDNPEHHHYPSYVGMYPYRESVAHWYKKRFDVALDPATEVIALIGSKEGIGHIPLAFVNHGDIVLVPSPSYPVYSVGTLFAGGEPYIMPLKEENGFLPDLKAIPEDILKRTKLMFLNYPNNPTATVASDGFFKEVIGLAAKYGIIVCHDAAYSEIYYGSDRPMSFLEVDGARDVGIEFHSLSKTYNMAGWRIGFAVGNRDVIAGLGKIKTNIDSGVFQAIQESAVVALQTEDSTISEIREIYQDRRDVLYGGIKRLGIEASLPKATFYIWARAPSGFNATTFVERLLDKAGVLVTPGVGFGVYGEGNIRFAITQPIERLREAVDRMGKAL